MAMRAASWRRRRCTGRAPHAPRRARARVRAARCVRHTTAPEVEPLAAEGGENSAARSHDACDFRKHALVVREEVDLEEQRQVDRAARYVCQKITAVGFDELD